MKKKLLLVIILNLILSCSSLKKVKESPSKNQPNKLTEINEIRKSLNGYWESKNQAENSEILWLNFNPKTNASWFLIVPKKNKYENINDVPDEYLNTVVKLIKEKNEIYFEISVVGIENSEKTILEYITASEFKISDLTFRKVEN
ncbi:hypothetical protein [Polaribacter sp. R77954]|uniref:hypothetical protein n=1 Tax=Polaribacter sp. R77954 TaxID=3093870 RepID=UPI0037C6986D